jgi:hypothetical protein
MRKSQKNLIVSLFTFLMTPMLLADFKTEMDVIKKMAGCYLVDYNFVETKAIKTGYDLDRRVYDVNTNKSVYEMIVPIEKSPTELRLQHILFTRDLKTGEMTSILKHQAEDWQYEANFFFDFNSPGHWTFMELKNNAQKWLRKVTHLDDGLRYQCASRWDLTQKNPEWSCENFAPIPGRETRDMGRKDYNTLERSSKIVVYADSFLERQNNVKTIWTTESKEALAQETGKTWWIKQEASQCEEANQFFKGHERFWRILMEVWEEYLTKPGNVSELSTIEGEPRYSKIQDIEEFSLAERFPPVDTQSIKKKIRDVIEQYRSK